MAGRDSLTRNQQSQIDAAAEGTRVLLDDGEYLKQGGQLVKAGSQTQGPTGFLGRLTGAGGEAVSGLKEAGKETIGAIPGMIQGIVGAPRQVWEDIKLQVTDPQRAYQEMRPRMESFARGMVPFRQTAEKIISGEPLSVKGVSKEIGEFGFSQFLPKAVGLGKRAVRFGVKELPGASVELHSLAIPEARAVPGIIRPTENAANAAYKALGDTARLNMSRFRATASELLRKEQGLANPDHAFISELQNFLKDSEEGWSFQKVKAEAERMGADLGQIGARRGATPTETPTGPARIKDRELRQMLEAMHADVEAGHPIIVRQRAQRAQPASTLVDPSGRPLREAVPARPAVTEAGEATPETIAKSQEWKDARRLARRDFAANGLARMIEDSISVVGDQFDSLNINPIIREIKRAQQKASYDKKAKLFVGSFEPGELNAIVDTLRDIGKHLPRIPAMRGTPVGSSQRFLTWATGELAGEMTGHPLVGGAIAILSAELISQALMTNPGRAFVRYAIRIDPTMGPAFVNTMGGFMRSQMGNTIGGPE